MGFSSENNGGGNNFSDWVVPLRTPLKPIYTGSSVSDDERETSSSSTPKTPTSEGSRIPKKLPCPPPPRKRKPSSAVNKMRCKNSNSSSKLYNGKREFFITPPDLETVFIRRHNVGC
ncbi:cyclin-dependent protein kinase inhibitor SMR6-like [Amaranthus tricolor]|uniref:cyclin-dependent protein kinase inhibitor SMR6-like n=1 Tax=Amaranthus tricolor TaxID=29722 RepID=UPI00258C1799|nr:cyclin-dependent protein kinase inhibitor SMR6-like [Amaranthus tricolor]